MVDEPIHAQGEKEIMAPKPALERVPVLQFP
jgi:hypothetical protein